MARPGLGTWVLDLDGVVWLTGEPIAGSPEAITDLRSAGARLLFVTNNASPTLDELLGRLARAGIAAERGEVVGAAEAAASLVAPGERVMLVGEEGAEEALTERGAVLVPGAPADAVVVGRSPAFDYERLAVASEAVRRGARLIGTSDDPTHPTPGGLVPGSGAIVAAVETAAGGRAEIAGKPHPAMLRCIRRRRPEVTTVVGDRATTDGLLARALGARFALVLSGVTTAGAPPSDPPPDATADDLWHLVHRVLTAEGGSDESPLREGATGREV